MYQFQAKNINKYNKKQKNKNEEKQELENIPEAYRKKNNLYKHVRKGHWYMHSWYFMIVLSLLNMVLL